MEYSRQCPDCGEKLTYSCERYLLRAISNNSVCIKCKKMPKGWLENVRKNNKNQKGKKKSKYVVSNKQPIFFRDCPDCSQQIGYKEERYFKAAEKKNSSCNSCTCKKYNIIQYLQTKESIQKMAATKAGFNSYKEYSDSIPAKKRYARDVWRVTRQQPIYTLENHNKRGR